MAIVQAACEVASPGELCLCRHQFSKFDFSDDKKQRTTFSVVFCFSIQCQIA